jgi:hypothetical protein
MEIINLNKKQYVKNQYEKVIDTKFSQLAFTPSPTDTNINEGPTIDEFFQMYDQLFFEIPKYGETNSHEYLIKTSSEYIEYTPISDEIQALIEEINLLQQTNLELNQQIINLQTSGSQVKI